MNDWYRTDCPHTLHALQVDPQQGLGHEAIAERLQTYGYNELAAKHKRNALRILGDQLRQVLVIILLAAAAINGLLLHEYLDTAVILVIVVLNTLLGFWQEYKADKALAALKKLAEPAVKVRRGGVTREIPAKELVPGDILLIQAGNIIPADARLIASFGLRVRESTLTGESVPVEKDHAFTAPGELILADRANMVFRGTTAVLGRGEAVVTVTGMHTELGKIASMLEQVKEEPTPLQKRLGQLGYVLALSAVVLILLVAAVSFLNRQDVIITVKTAISMAVAAIPEGLPAVVTISLALGARKLFRRNSLIRNLPSVETLGSVTVICSDKTGTLTQNKMTVTALVTGDREVALEGLRPGNIIKSNPHLALLLMGGALCNDAEIHTDSAEPDADGDPTETALAFAAHKAGLDKAELERLFPRRDELAFSSERKRMTTVHDIPPASTWDAVFRTVFPDGHPVRFALTKGAVDELLDVCTYILSRGKLLPLTDADKWKLLTHNRSLADRGMRIIGMAVKPLKTRRGRISVRTERDLIFIGMSAMIDPVRREVKTAVQTCRKAGIRPVMITGDHPATALAVAKQLGITRDNTYVSGRDLERLNAEELADTAQTVSVYARVNPEHKTRLVDALQSRGQVVAMTGDGVNDAPALKAADIGVAMGITGTDVSKQAADMVLLDDNFATIVNAVREGRTIYDNIKRFIRYILSGNLGEILVMLFGPLLGLALPLLPLQILWINLVTDGAPAVAMGYEPAEQGVMQRPPFRRGESMFTRGTGRQIIWTGIFMAVACLGLGLFFALSGAAEEKWRTVIFTTVTLCQLQLALGVRSSHTSIFKLSPSSNIPLAVSVAATFVLQLLLIYLPFFQLIFKTVPLSPAELGLCLTASLLILLGVEVEKTVLRKKKLLDFSLK